MDPLLKWAGGKRWQAPALCNVWNNDHVWRRLVEPFCGGASVTFALNPNFALLNDKNAALINFYRHVQAGASFRFDGMKPELYHQIRSGFNSLIQQGQVDTLTTAEYFYVLNQWAFNGLWRVNSKGEFNVPPRPVLRPLSVPDLDNYKAVMAAWLFDSRDFEQLALDPDDFVYADPPYDGGYTGYTSEGFTWDDQARLAMWLSMHPGPVVLMNKATKRILKLYDSLGFTTTLINARQRIHHSRGNNGTVLEVMATNPALDPRDIMEIE